AGAADAGRGAAGAADGPAAAGAAAPAVGAAAAGTPCGGVWAENGLGEFSRGSSAPHPKQNL
ncbi:MAG TPA: hypothetical protein PKA88_10845, partial [Polyangiaceae bacterium]|nr:hypothetical protein [Polyangiaceae bacterium]